MKRFLFILIIIGLPIYAKYISLSQINHMPKSIAKDYYIWRFLKQTDTSKREAIIVIKEIKRLNGKLRKAYKEKTGHRAKAIKKKETHLPISSQARANYLHNMQNLRIFKSSSTPFDTWLSEDNSVKIFIFNHIGKILRKRLDREIGSSLWRDLTMYSTFNKSISIMRKESLPKLKKSLLFLPAKKNHLNYTTLNHLAFHALYSHKKSIATTYFWLSSTKANEREKMDRALFWAYMTSHNKYYLKTMTKSYDINLYTLLARDKLGLPYPKVLSPVLPDKKLNKPWIVTSPIYWVTLKKKIFDKKHDLNHLANLYRDKETVGFYTYIEAKASKDTKQYFPMPYQSLLAKLPKTRQAMMYAIIRQESRFVPASISSSFALGIMQIMPFLVDHLAKIRHEKIDYDDMFNPRTALIYGNEHMNYLTKWLKHPLYIAYAYNAGIGFTRRMLKSKRYFTKDTGYEPYLSIERLPNAQANRYGKHVMTNYVIYMNLLGVPLKMTNLIKTLNIPNMTDNFRKRK